MTGIGGVIFGPPPPTGTKWIKIKRKIRRAMKRWRKQKTHEGTQFVVLCFRRTGSNWLCGMLFNHPQILMHNEIFNENGVHTYYKSDVLANNWDYEGRDINPNGFLNFMFSPSKFAKFRHAPSECKAVGYKSFPNHYLHKAVPLIRTYDAYHNRILRNPDVHKIILFREDVLRTYLSSRRAFETGIYMSHEYQSHKIYVDLVDLQRFVNRYYQSYDEYRMLTQGHPRSFVTYETLCKDPKPIMKKIWHFLGVDQHIEPEKLDECIPQSSSVAPLRDSIENYDDVEFACRHDPELSKYLDLGDIKISQLKVEQQSSKLVTRPQKSKWALLIPVRSAKDDTIDICSQRIRKMCDAIKKTSRKNDYPLLIFGVDDDDFIYLEKGFLQSVCKEFFVEVQTMYGLQGKICRIWKRLAQTAYETHQADFTLLLGDDVIIESNGWQDSIEKKFESIANQRSLPYGAACVAFMDRSFPGFPTFPVIHRWHFEVFRRILPSEFDNQGGDPFLFELYKRFGSATFDFDSILENTIGGKADARYVKQRLRFEDNILTNAIKCVKQNLPQGHYTVPCLDIVVPCYRCDLEILDKILSLRTSRLAQVSFWIVLDNPNHPRSDQVRDLAEVRDNYQINVVEQYDSQGNARNCGASAARNYGLAHSKADFCVLLDDDVIPMPILLDAYLGAIMRSPNASVFVGSTHLPSPHNLLTHAIIASDIPGAYTIAERTREPPWGVTANICVRARDSRIRFDLSYPKTGGGEDLDFCARARKHGPIRSVPGARADHPWWNDGKFKAVLHILAWAEGEVLCVGKSHMREHVFWTFPNGVEMIVFTSLFTYSCHGGIISGFSKSFFLSFLILIMELLWHASRIKDHRLRSPVKGSMWRSTIVRLTAAALIILQEFMRMFQALDHNWGWVLWRVDWHFGLMPHLVTNRKWNNFIRAVIYIFMCCFVNS